MLPVKFIWTCPQCANREERPGDDGTSDWGCPNCGTWMKRRAVHPRATTPDRPSERSPFDSDADWAETQLRDWIAARLPNLPEAQWIELADLLANLRDRVSASDS